MSTGAFFVLSRQDAILSEHVQTIVVMERSQASQ
jgi:hypothetical protein